MTSKLLEAKSLKGRNENKGKLQLLFLLNTFLSRIRSLNTWKSKWLLAWDLQGPQKYIFLKAI